MQKLDDHDNDDDAHIFDIGGPSDRRTDEATTSLYNT